MAKQQYALIDLPANFDPKDMESIGKDILAMIRDRCDLGIGVKPRGAGWKTYDFPAYTPEYAARKGQKKVDLQFSEEMLDSMEVLKIADGQIKIGFRAGSKVNAKAEGNQIGSYGRDPNPKKARSFLGVTKDELEAILAVYTPVSTEE